MKIAIPTSDGKLCAHFGHCQAFTFAEIDENTKEITTIEEKIPTEGISCKSAAWVAEQGAEIVLAGGMGARPLQMFENCGVKVIAGCPDEDIESVLNAFLEQNLVREYYMSNIPFKNIIYIILKILNKIICKC